MKKLTLLLAFLLSLHVMQAQDDYNSWMHADGTLEGFTPGSMFYTLVSDANLRDKPGTQSAVLTKLPIGTPVSVEAVTTDSFTQRGVKLPWVKVTIQQTNKPPVTGFIWGGFLALAAIQTPDDEYMPNRNVLYLVGVAAFDEEKHQVTVQVRTALQGKELSKCEFTTAGDLSYYPSVDLKFESFKNVKAVLTVDYFYPACGYPSGNSMLFWLENNQLVRVLETSSISDGGVFYDSQDCLLPSDKGGIGDHVVVVNDHSEFEERDDELVRTVQTYQVTVYKWTGVKLQKMKELK